MMDSDGYWLGEVVCGIMLIFIELLVVSIRAKIAV